jgi:hypothetical protein
MERSSVEPSLGIESTVTLAADRKPLSFAATCRNGGAGKSARRGMLRATCATT